MGLPSGVVARWVRAVELVALNCIVACVHERNTERSAAAHLGVDVLVVGEVAHELLNVDWAALAVQVSLAEKATHVNEVVCIGNDSRNRDHDVIVHLVELATLTNRNKEGGEFLLLGSHNHT